jgi:hypothetical protein
MVDFLRRHADECVFVGLMLLVFIGKFASLKEPSPRLHVRRKGTLVIVCALLAVPTLHMISILVTRPNDPFGFWGLLLAFATWVGVLKVLVSE